MKMKNTNQEIHSQPSLMRYIVIYTESFINRFVWVQGCHHVANETVLIVEYITYYIIARTFKN